MKTCIQGLAGLKINRLVLGEFKMKGSCKIWQILPGEAVQPWPELGNSG